VFKLQKINDFISIGILDLKAFSVEQTTLNKREQERAGTQFVLKNLLQTQAFELCYTHQNKPFLNNRTEHISISHSHNKLVVIINTQQSTGIDIELIRDKVINIQHKFLNENEIAMAHNDVAVLITLWAAKEAMYKAYGLKELDFKQHLFVDQWNDRFIVGKMQKEECVKNYTLAYERIEDYMMVYVLNEKESKN
jgi:4'-phosphopantetheinyl transferase